jgi:hypothetical protein
MIAVLAWSLRAAAGKAYIPGPPTRSLSRIRRGSVRGTPVAGAQQ